MDRFKLNICILNTSLLLFHRYVFVLRVTSSLEFEWSTPAWIHALVQGHAYSIHLCDRTIEVSLEVPMCTQALADVSRAPVLGMQLNRGVVSYVLGVKEHVADCGSLFVDLERVSSEDDSFGDDTLSIGVHERARCYKLGT